MLKRNTNLYVKALLLILLVLLFLFIFRVPAEAQQIKQNKYYYATKTYEYLTLRNFSPASGKPGNRHRKSCGRSACPRQ